MRCCVFWLLLLLSALPAAAAELSIRFNDLAEDQVPDGFRSAVMGVGKPGDWRIVFDDVPSPMPGLLTNGPVMEKKAVLGQLSHDPRDEHFPMFIYQGETFGDFTLTTRFKTVSGVMEQMAGIAFRIQDETNYYIARASSLGHNFRFYKVVNGLRSPSEQWVTLPVDTPAGQWHELQIQCSGNTIVLCLDGTNTSPRIQDDSFSRGKIGFWTKSDSVSYFGDTRVVYTPLVSPAQTLISEMAKKYSKLLDLRIYMAGKAPDSTRVAASKDPKEVGQPGGTAELDVMRRGLIYYGKNKASVTVTMPLHDRNGDLTGAVRIVMKSFSGETEETALARATPVMKEIQDKATAFDDIFD